MAAPTGKGLTCEKIWAMFRETDRQIKQTGREMKEGYREMKESYREIRQGIKEASRIVGDLGNKLGIVVEHLVLSNILEKFNELGYEFSKMGPNIRIEDKKKNIIAEVDAMLENGDYALAIEVKTQLNVKDVDEHTRRMDKLRRYADDRRDTRKLIGAVAGAIVANNVKEYALRKGFYVIKQSGDTVKIDIPRGFTPKTWKAIEDGE
jgi:hypothetical protein